MLMMREAKKLRGYITYNEFDRQAVAVDASAAALNSGWSELEMLSHITCRCNVALNSALQEDPLWLVSISQ